MLKDFVESLIIALVCFLLLIIIDKIHYEKIMLVSDIISASAVLVFSFLYQQIKKKDDKQ